MNDFDGVNFNYFFLYSSEVRPDSKYTDGTKKKIHLLIGTRPGNLPYHNKFRPGKLNLQRNMCYGNLLGMEWSFIVLWVCMVTFDVKIILSRGLRKRQS